MKKRLKEPSNNKYYIRTVTGGLNGAVEGYPVVKGANVLANCVGFCNGRFAESQNDPDLKGIYLPFKYQLVCNAENFIESAKAQGLKISSTPTLGGIMVWQKGATLKGSDGAGHVAFVEEVIDEDTIMTSESGYNAFAFKTVKRTNKNGRWGQAEGYKFRGCIINPSIKTKKKTYKPTGPYEGKLPKTTVKYGTDGPDVKRVKAFLKWYQNADLNPKNDKCRSKTVAEIKKFEKSQGIKADGIFGPVTLGKAKEVVKKYADKYAEKKQDPLQPWFDALREQYEWSKNQNYKWINPPTIANSKKNGTCISLPACALQRLGLFDRGGWIFIDLKTGKINGNKAAFVLAHPELFEVFYPNKTIKQLGDKIKPGDIVAYTGGRGHIQVFKGFNKKGQPIFDEQGHRRGLNITSGYGNKKINMIVRLKKTKR